MLLKAQNFIKQHLAQPSQILLAYSGGVDSVVLLHLLLQAGHKPALAHCNFNLRPAAIADAQFAKDQAVQLGLKLHLKSFATQAFADENRVSIQMAARSLRYTFFEELQRQQGYTYLLTAHHLDDSIETLLINLSRGTGIAGLTGITSQSDDLLRPLNTVSKEEILAYAKTHNLTWQEDASNASTKYARNYLRHKVIPAWRDGASGFNTALGKSLQNLNQQNIAFESLLKEKLNVHLVQEDQYEKLPWLNFPYASSLLHYWLKDLSPVDYAALNKVKQNAEYLDFSTAYFELFYNRGFFWLNRNPVKAYAEPIAISANQKKIDTPFKLELTQLPADNKKPDFKANHAYLDFDKLDFPLLLRPWQQGDKFIPLGMKGHKKLSDFYTDKKLSAKAKKEQWVLCSGPNIVWVVGQQIDERYKLTNWTKTIYFAKLIK